ncbi:MAG TPA: glutamyl-tRNA reductase [Armatimonadota bacterium]|jgi:glutamyl-tRNA reductase
MHLVIVGLSHHTAPVGVREVVAFAPGQIRDALRDLRAIPGVQEVAVLSTCNRTEAYALCDSPDPSPISTYLCRGHESPRDHLYSYVDEGAPAHLFRVASGADSMVLGEGQVLGQVREAGRLAVEESAAGPVIRRLFDQAMVCGRRARNETEIARGAVSVSHMAVELARQIFGNLKDKNVLLLGAGETAELTARLMAKYGVSLITVANRTFERAEALAEALGGRAVRYDEFPERMVKADIVVSSTAAPHAIIHQDVARLALAQRRGKPMFLIDLAMPRDIEPSVGDLDNVFLYNLDDLQVLVSRNLDDRRTELTAVDAIIEEETEAFMRWLGRLRTVPVMTELQRRFDAIRTAELQRTERRLEGLSPEQRDAVDQMTHAMVKKMLHEPWRYLKSAGSDAQAAATLQAIVDVFDLEDAFRDSGSPFPGEGEPDAADQAPAARNLSHGL